MLVVEDLAKQFVAFYTTCRFLASSHATLSRFLTVKNWLRYQASHMERRVKEFWVREVTLQVLLMSLVSVHLPALHDPISFILHDTKNLRN